MIRWRITLRCVCLFQMEAGVQRLSSHFTWPEFCDQRRDFHQDFVYNVTMFAATCGFPWSEVAQAAVMAKALFPKLDCQSARLVPLSLLSLSLLQPWNHHSVFFNRQVQMSPRCCPCWGTCCPSICWTSALPSGLSSPASSRICASGSAGFSRRCLGEPPRRQPSSCTWRCSPPPPHVLWHRWQNQYS